jgi:hypothetical protein
LRRFKTAGKNATLCWEISGGSKTARNFRREIQISKNNDHKDFEKKLAAVFVKFDYNIICEN